MNKYCCSSNAHTRPTQLSYLAVVVQSPSLVEQSFNLLFTHKKLQYLNWLCYLVASTEPSQGHMPVSTFVLSYGDKARNKNN